jgi:hypothetical protein
VTAVPALLSVLRLCGHSEPVAAGGRFGQAWLRAGARTVLCAACQARTIPDALGVLARQTPKRCACGYLAAPDLGAFAALEGIEPQPAPEDIEAPTEAWALDVLHPDHPGAYLALQRHCPGPGRVPGQLCGSTFSLLLPLRRGAR